jgi:hypothetical protein
MAKIYLQLAYLGTIDNSQNINRPIRSNPWLWASLHA